MDRSSPAVFTRSSARSVVQSSVTLLEIALGGLDDLAAGSPDLDGIATATPAVAHRVVGACAWLRVNTARWQPTLELPCA
jgi:hypothetical protein